MQIVVISPEWSDAREAASMQGLFEAGLERYHVRKPAWTPARLESWLLSLPAAWRPRIVVHAQAGLARRLAVGWHERDRGRGTGARGLGRSCHDLLSLGRRLGLYPYLFFGPVFPSITKRGYGPAADFPWERLSRVLKRSRAPAQTRVFAIGGITPGGLARCAALGFDGVAVMGAVWNGPDPVGAYRALRAEAARLEAPRHAA
ncbi:MAG: thiamine phosphate synthase [Opitutaceae bacterium]